MLPIIRPSKFNLYAILNITYSKFLKYIFFILKIVNQIVIVIFAYINICVWKT